MGISTKLDKPVVTTSQAKNGTPRYMAPEQLDGKLTLKIDVWAFGCVLLQLYTGTVPYEGIVNQMAVFVKIKEISPLNHFLS